jgi:hypothetical protein
MTLRQCQALHRVASCPSYKLLPEEKIERNPPVFLSMLSKEGNGGSASIKR